MKSAPFVLILLACWSAAQFAGAATRTVTNTADSGPGSLRDTIAASAAGDTIRFSGALLGNPTIRLTSGQLVIGRDLTITDADYHRWRIDGNHSTRVFSILAGTTVNLSGLTITNGFGTNTDGGGIFNDGTLSMTRCTLSHNQVEGGYTQEAIMGGSGGGIYNRGTLRLIGCTLSDNSAIGACGGCVDNTLNGGLGKGGGIASVGMLSLTNCTFSNNRAVGGRGGAQSDFSGGADGGAIHIHGVTTNFFVNCTIRSNVCQGGNGARNGNGSASGGGIVCAYAIIELMNTLISDNTAITGSGGSDYRPEVDGPILSQGFNLIGIINGSSGWIASDRTGTSVTPLSALLGPLQNNGGNTFTMAPLPGSAALDAGNSGGAPTDQTGRTRPFDIFSIANASGGDGSDIGAYEVQGPVITAQPQPPSQLVAAGQNVTYSVAATGVGTMTYRWRKDEVNIPGATSSSYTRANVQPADAGSYSVVISDSFGASTGSDPAVLNVGFTLTSSVNGLGTVVPNPDLGLYVNNSPVTLTASPAAGWGFSGWSGHANGTNNPLRVTMTNNKSITANFTNPSGCVFPAGLVSWWPGGNANDVIGNNNGTFLNGATNASGKVGTAFSFDGVNDYVDMGNASSLNFVNQSFSVEAWIYLTQAADGVNVEGIVSRYGHTTTGSASWMLGRGASGHLWFALDSNGLWSPERIVPSTNVTSLNQWHHVAAVYDHSTSTGMMRLYVDGVLNSSDAGPPITVYSSTAKTTIGAWFYYDGANGAQAIPGLVDEAAIYNRAISGSEIAAIHNAGSVGKCLPTCTSAPSGLVSWWPGTGNANDIIGNNNGTLQNGATKAAGKVGQGFSFDGVNDNVSFPDSATLSITGALSIEAWIKPNSLPSGRGAIVTKYNSTLVNGASYLLAYYPSFGLRFIVFANDSNYRAAATITNAIPPDAFAHVAATFNPAGQVMKLYVNGVEIPATIEPGAGTVSAIMDNQAPVRLGALMNGSGQLDYLYSGLIDEVGLYNRELGATEVQSIYASGSAGKCLTPLYITSVNKSGNNLNLSWQAQLNATYRVQYKTNLNAATWVNVSGDVTATTNTASKTDSTLGNASQRFYRVELQP